MMQSRSFKDKNVAVFGLGKSGLATAVQLQKGEASLNAWDDNPKGLEAAKKLGLNAVSYADTDWGEMDALVLSPGVPLTHPKPHPVVEAANLNHVPVIGDVEVFLREKTAGRVVGITGTNGKSTTSTLIHHLLKVANVETALGGNIGTPVMDLPQLGEEGNYVLELSSYQLDLTPSWHADVAVLLNITPDHLDRHGSMDGYVAVKRRIFQKQVAGDVAVINIDDPVCAEIHDELKVSGLSELVAISTAHRDKAAVSVVDGVVVSKSIDGFDLDGIAALRGAHNWQNAAAAVAVCEALGVSGEDIIKGLKSFGGLAHRMEQIAVKGQLTFVNDSKATNADAAEKSLTSFDNIYWICGGVAKAGGIEGLKQHFPRVKEVFLIGECADEFAGTLDGVLPFNDCETLEKAVELAEEKAKQSGEESVILLAPAAASFDQFASFEARGDAFRNIVLGGAQ